MGTRGTLGVQGTGINTGTRKAIGAGEYRFQRSCLVAGGLNTVQGAPSHPIPTGVSAAPLHATPSCALILGLIV